MADCTECYNDMVYGSVLNKQEMFHGEHDLLDNRTAYLM